MKGLLVGSVLMVSNALAQPQSLPASYRFLALGDSYTVAEALPTDSGWPAQFQAFTKSNGKECIEYVQIARTGWRCDQLMEAAQAAKLPSHFDLVTLLIGVNNQYQGKSVAEFQTQFSHALAFAVSRCSSGARGVAVLNIPDYGLSPFAEGRAGISQQIDAFNQVIATECQKAGVPVVDVCTISRNNHGEEQFAADGLHPSEEQYALWAGALQSIVQ